MNRLTQEIGQACRELPLQDKWLICPNNRIGWQWLESAARAGFGLVNLRPRTLRTVALDLAKGPMAREGLVYLHDRGAVLVVEKIREEMGDRLSYFPSSQTGLGPLLHKALADLRLAGLGPGDLEQGRFEDQAKGCDLSLVLDSFIEKLRSKKLLDYAGVLDLARMEAEQNSSLLKDKWLLIPEFLDLGFLERRLRDVFPSDRVIILKADRPWSESDPEAGEFPETDLDLLRWIDHPAQAPAPLNDETVTIQRAVGEVNEIRAALRSCLAEGVPLDTVELLYTDKAAYLPLIHETLSKIRALEEASGELPPATFAEGVPGLFARPCRALAGWVAWVRSNFAQTHLVRLIREGLLVLPEQGEDGPGFADLAQVLGSLGVGLGRERYLDRVQRELRSLEARKSGPGPGDPEEFDSSTSEHREKAMLVLGELIRNLWEFTPDYDAPAKEILEKAVKFVAQGCRTINELDNNARLKLGNEIEGLLAWSETAGVLPEGDIWDWLAQLPQQVHLLGSGPRPGMIHVAPLLSGGHSGRPRTFILGLDDGRFPGAGLQDPILLDNERTKLSDRLTTAAADLGRKNRQLGLLLAQLRGRVTLSYSCWNLVRDAEMFPAGALLSAFRLVSGIRDGDLTGMNAWLGPPRTFAPEPGEPCLDKSEYWLRLLCGANRPGNAGDLVRATFPHLGQGAAAETERGKSVFGPFDGLVRQAGQDPSLDPLRMEGPVMSSQRLEHLGKCPLGYFFKYILGLKPLEEPVTDPEDWLGAMERGNILHQAFHEYLEELINQERLPDFERDRERLEQIIDELVDREAELSPPPDPEILNRRRNLLHRVGSVFLKEEQEFCRTSKPVYLEAEIGWGRETGSLARGGPVEIALPTGRKIRARGRLDRIDRREGKEGPIYSVWDYKTGSAKKYDPDKPFAQGRIIQHFLYLALAAEALKQVDPQARVERFGYMFASLVSRGERMEWTGEQLLKGPGVVEDLCRIVSLGAFTATDNAKDCQYCDYAALCGEAGRAAAQAATKLAAPENKKILEPFRAVREVEDD